MSITLVSQDAVTVLRLGGDVDMDDVVALRNALHSITKEGQCCFVLDFSRVAHMSITSIGILADTVMRVRNLGGDVKLAHVNMHLRQIFDLTGFSTMVQVYKNAEEANASYRDPAIAAA
jgi:anti-sigma B factor antagonist